VIILEKNFITFNKVYIYLGKITHLSLHSFSLLLNLKNTKYVLKTYMKNYDFQEKEFQISDPIESYFECISICDINDGNCFSRCVEILKQNEN